MQRRPQLPSLNEAETHRFLQDLGLEPVTLSDIVGFRPWLYVMEDRLRSKSYFKKLAARPSVVVIEEPASLEDKEFVNTRDGTVIPVWEVIHRKRTDYWALTLNGNSSLYLPKPRRNLESRTKRAAPGNLYFSNEKVMRELFPLQE
jgi:hypothetical protein